MVVKARAQKQQQQPQQRDALPVEHHMGIDDDDDVGAAAAAAAADHSESKQDVRTPTAFEQRVYKVRRRLRAGWGLGALLL